jgi:hypothetical protein
MVRCCLDAPCAYTTVDLTACSSLCTSTTGGVPRCSVSFSLACSDTHYASGGLGTTGKVTALGSLHWKHRSPPRGFPFTLDVIVSALHIFCLFLRVLGEVWLVSRCGCSRESWVSGVRAGNFFFFFCIASRGRMVWWFIACVVVDCKSWLQWLGVQIRTLLVNITRCRLRHCSVAWGGVQDLGSRP